MHVVITGANRGIGQALFDRYITRGDQVTGTARSGGGLTKLDVTRPGDFRALAASLDGRPIDLLICNAGIYPDKGQTLVDGFSPEIWAETLTTNVTGVFLTVQSLLAGLQAGTSPRVAILSSRLGSQDLAAGGSYAYRASKAAALNLGRNLAVDLAPLGIAVGIYHPGWVRTDMGGTQGDIDVATSAEGLIREFDHLNLDKAGCFRTWDGQDLPF